MATGETAVYANNLIQEARELFTQGHFYGCVAMCGIAGERIIKDIFRHNFLIGREGDARRPSEKAIERFERVEISKFIDFCRESQLISKEVAADSRKLCEIRNTYAHGNGTWTESEALKAVELLTKIISGSVMSLQDWMNSIGATVKRP